LFAVVVVVVVVVVETTFYPKTLDIFILFGYIVGDIYWLVIIDVG
jgi:hypothetical protein